MASATVVDVLDEARAILCSSASTGIEFALLKYSCGFAPRKLVLLYSADAAAIAAAASAQASYHHSFSDLQWQARSPTQTPRTR
jgi:hypothetical protein